jgi:hypothetical protein
MSPLPTRLPRFPLLGLFFMRIPSGSSLILALLVVSSSLSVLAAPVGDGLVQPNSEPLHPVAPTTTFLSNTATDHPQTSNFVDKGTAPLPVVSVPVKAIPDLIHAIINFLVGKDTPKACASGETLDPVKTLVPTVKTTWAEEVDEGGDCDEDSYLVAAHQDAAVAGPDPSIGFLSQPLLPRGHAGRQVGDDTESRNGGGGSDLKQAPPPN